jgi:hypothetical protein
MSKKCGKKKAKKKNLKKSESINKLWHTITKTNPTKPPTISPMSSISAPCQRGRGRGDRGDGGEMEGEGREGGRGERGRREISHERKFSDKILLNGVP